jgi:molybdenum cofactor synthesis domain-containing protein
VSGKLSSPIRAAVVTLSDKASAGLRADASGPLLVELLRGIGAIAADAIVIPDDQPTIERTLRELADGGVTDLVLTTGGTGLAPRDHTPEATLAVADRPAPGFAEAMRAASLSVTPNAMLSRAASAVRKQTLIINMPGSPKACREHFAVIAPVFGHAVETLRGEAFECASPNTAAAAPAGALTGV